MVKKVGVIILNNPKAVDRIFTYLADGEMATKIKVGSRVIVPFGAGNRNLEGYVLTLDETKDDVNLKKITKLYDDFGFDEKGAELIEYIRKTTVCTYGEAARLLIPSGFGAKIKKVVCLCGGMCEYETEHKEVIEFLKNNACDLDEIEVRLGKSARKAAESLIKEGLAKLSFKVSEKVKERREKFFSLISKKEAEDYAAGLPERSKKQADIVFYLLAEGKEKSAAEVFEATGANNQAALTLEKNGIIKISEKRVMRNPVSESAFETKESDFAFTEEQSKVFMRVYESVLKGDNERFLLHGVTGAGKTEVFIQLIRKCLDMGKSAIMLVPEIALTPMMTNRFAKRFGKNVAILHSKLSKGERLDEWDRIQKGEAKVVLGARSAVFAPLDNIGIIIIDEEHEMSYKSENAPRYHARDIAFFKAEQNKAAVLMASATPSVESYYFAKKGDYVLLEMKERFNKNPLPEVYVCDMREELSRGNRSMFSARLADEVLYNKRKGEQAILLLNRRGFSTFVSCRECGFVANCPHCNISLTYHKSKDYLSCHYCGYTIKNYKACPKCESKYIKYFGSGTQKLEEEINTRFSDCSVIRMDVDTTGGKRGHEKILDKFSKGDADILMGTQMVAKGLDFPNVTLVGVMAADSGLYIDDYRSGEKTFSLLEQVIGRAGRAALPGRAFIQTYSPENSVIKHVKNHDYVGFYNEEIKLRKVMNYPPFCKIGSILVSGKSEIEVKNLTERMFKWLEKEAKERDDIVLLGPCASAIGKIKDKFRYRILIKHKKDISDILKKAQDTFIKGGYNKTMTLALDINPANLS